jgi:hypothetical protein
MRLLDVKAERAAKENEMKMIRNEVSGRVQIQPQIQLFDNEALHDRMKYSASLLKLEHFCGQLHELELSNQELEAHRSQCSANNEKMREKIVTIETVGILKQCCYCILRRKRNDNEADFETLLWKFS